MQFIKVAQKNELKDGEKKKILIDGKALLLANVQGTYFSIDDKCPHMGASLSEGSLNGFGITCPKHGSVFDVRTGKLISSGKIAFMHVKVKDTRSYPVKVEGDDILIGLE